MRIAIQCYEEIYYDDITDTTDYTPVSMDYINVETINDLKSFATLAGFTLSFDEDTLSHLLCKYDGIYYHEAYISEDKYIQLGGEF